MAAPVTQNPTARPESKSAKKKKSKTGAPEVAPFTSAPAADEAPSNSAPESSNGEASYESPYIKELYK